LPSALALIPPSQNQHGKTVKGETPYHTEGVRFAKDNYIASAEQDGEQLQTNDQIDDAIAGAILLLRLTKPVSEDAIFRDAIKNAVGSNDRSVDCARKN